MPEEKPFRQKPNQPLTEEDLKDHAAKMLIEAAMLHRAAWERAVEGPDILHILQNTMIEIFIAARSSADAHAKIPEPTAIEEFEFAQKMHAFICTIGGCALGLRPLYERTEDRLRLRADLSLN